MKTIGVLLIGLLLPLIATAKAPKAVRSVTQQQLKQLNEKIKNPSFVVEMMNTVKSRGSQINILRRHLSAADLRALKQQGDLLKVNFRGRLHINLHDANSFSFEDKTKVFKFSQDGKSVSLGAAVFKIDRKQSLLTNYKAILAQIKTQAHFSAGCQIISCAHALSSEDSMGYNLTTLLYYMDVHTAGDGSIMWDYFLEEPAIQKALAGVTKAGKSIRSMSCDDLGMTIEYSDGTKSYLTTNGKRGSEFEMTISETQSSGGSEQMVDGADSATAGSGWFYYCGKMGDTERQNTVNFLNGNLLAPSPILDGDVEQ